MTGFKQAGDIRLRTPMQWTRGPAAGFTRATPWEPLPPDSATASVEALDSDPASLLNLHRKLIHLRTSHPALGAGRFVPLTTENGALAYLRTTGSSTALVLANLGDTPLSSVKVSAAGNVLPAGRYRTSAIFGSAPAATLRVGGNGRIANWVAAPALAPFETVILDIRKD